MGEDTKESLRMSQQLILLSQKYGSVGNGVNKSESTCHILVNVTIRQGCIYRSHWYEASEPHA
jgi:hypothetical protein